LRVGGKKNQGGPRGRTNRFCFFGGHVFWGGVGGGGRGWAGGGGGPLERGGFFAPKKNHPGGGGGSFFSFFFFVVFSRPGTNPPAPQTGLGLGRFWGGGGGPKKQAPPRPAGPEFHWFSHSSTPQGANLRGLTGPGFPFRNFRANTNPTGNCAPPPTKARKTKKRRSRTLSYFVSDKADRARKKISFMASPRVRNNGLVQRVPSGCSGRARKKS